MALLGERLGGNGTYSKPTGRQNGYTLGIPNGNQDDNLTGNKLLDIIKPQSGKMKKITKQKPYFDEKGNLYLPDDLKFAGQLNPPLNTKEWSYLLLTIADKSRLPQGREDELIDILIGSKSSAYRVKRSLKSKGYL